MLPCSFTFTLTAAYNSFLPLYNLTNVVPVPTAVTTPVFSSTVATFSSADLNTHVLSGTSFNNKLNSIDMLYVICSVSPAFWKLIIFLSTLIFFLLIHHGVVKLCTVSFPISPFSL